jgi:hypothetical protein
MHPLFPVATQSAIAVPFRQSAAIDSGYQGYMQPRWTGPLQGLIQSDLSVGAVDKIVPSNHVIDFKIVIIDNDRKLVRCYTTATRDHKIAKLGFRIQVLRTMELVMKLKCARGHAKSP